MRRLAALACSAAAALAAGCGPTGPSDRGGSDAEPVQLLTVLPVPAGLADERTAHEVDPTQLLTAMAGTTDPALGARLREAGGLEHAAVRTFRAPRGGRMWASVSVWPTRGIASNVALTIGQRQLGRAGVSAWTPGQVPGSQGTRQSGGARERVLVRSVGPNALVVRAVGDVPDDAVARTMERLVVVQQARD